MGKQKEQALIPKKKSQEEMRWEPSEWHRKIKWCSMASDSMKETTDSGSVRLHLPTGVTSSVRDLEMERCENSTENNAECNKKGQRHKCGSKKLCFALFCVAAILTLAAVISAVVVRQQERKRSEATWGNEVVNTELPSYYYASSNRVCWYNGRSWQHGATKEDRAYTCSCNNGQWICVRRIAPAKCLWNGRNYDNDQWALVQDNYCKCFNADWHECIPRTSLQLVKNSGKSCQVFAGGDATKRSLEDSRLACLANENCNAIVCPQGRTTGCTLRERTELITWAWEDCYILKQTGCEQGGKLYDEGAELEIEAEVCTCVENEWQDCIPVGACENEGEIYEEGEILRFKEAVGAKDCTCLQKQWVNCTQVVCEVNGDVYTEGEEVWVTQVCSCSSGKLENCGPPPSLNGSCEWDGELYKNGTVVDFPEENERCTCQDSEWTLCKVLKGCEDSGILYPVEEWVEFDNPREVCKCSPSLIWTIWTARLVTAGFFQCTHLNSRLSCERRLWTDNFSWNTLSMKMNAPLATMSAATSVTYDDQDRVVIHD
eukprot:g82051.t1